MRNDVHFSGVGTYLKEKNSNIQVVLADPQVGGLLVVLFVLGWKIDCASEEQLQFVWAIPSRAVSFSTGSSTESWNGLRGVPSRKELVRVE